MLPSPWDALVHRALANALTAICACWRGVWLMLPRDPGYAVFLREIGYRGIRGAHLRRRSRTLRHADPSSAGIRRTGRAPSVLFCVPGSADGDGSVRGGDEGGGGGDEAAGTCTVTIKAPNLACFKRVWTPSNCHFSTICIIRKLKKPFVFNAYGTNESPPLRQVTGATRDRSDGFRRIADSSAVEDLLPRP